MNNSNPSKWRTVKSEYVVNERFMKMRADMRVSPDGKAIKEPWYVIENPAWVNCLVVDDQDNVVMLKHYRHGIDDYVLEIIGGNADTKGDSPIKAMQRELREEIGYRGGNIYEVGTVWANPSVMNNKNYCYLAVGGTLGARQEEDDVAADFSEVRIPFPEFVKRISNPDSNEIFQSLHLANIFHSFNLIRASSDPAVAHLKKYL